MIPPRNRDLAPSRQNPALCGISAATELRHHVVNRLRGTLARYPADPRVTGLVDGH